MSNLPFVYKITEKAQFNQLHDHMNRVQCFSRGQSAFSPFYRAETAMLNVLFDILLSMDRKKVTPLSHAWLNMTRMATDSSRHWAVESWFVVGWTLLNWSTSYLSQQVQVNMMTSSNGNIFRVTGPLCEEFTGHRWIPRTKASDAKLWCFLWSAPE